MAVSKFAHSHYFFVFLVLGWHFLHKPYRYIEWNRFSNVVKVRFLIARVNFWSENSFIAPHEMQTRWWWVLARAVVSYCASLPGKGWRTIIPTFSNSSKMLYIEPRAMGFSAFICSWTDCTVKCPSIVRIYSNTRSRS